MLKTPGNSLTVPSYGRQQPRNGFEEFDAVPREASLPFPNASAAAVASPRVDDDAMAELRKTYCEEEIEEAASKIDGALEDLYPTHKGDVKELRNLSHNAVTWSFFFWGHRCCKKRHKWGEGMFANGGKHADTFRTRWRLVPACHGQRRRRWGREATSPRCLTRFGEEGKGYDTGGSTRSLYHHQRHQGDVGTTTNACSSTPTLSLSVSMCLSQAVSKATQDVEEAQRDFDAAKKTMDAKKEVLDQKKLLLQSINTEGGQNLSIRIVFSLRFVGEDPRSL